MVSLADRQLVGGSLVALLSLAAPALGAGRTEPATRLSHVVPGGILRWSGADECEQQGRRFAPLAGTCYFPIDLAADGTVGLARRHGATWERRDVRVDDYPYPTQSIEGVDDKYVAPSKAELERIRRDQERAGRAFALRTPGRFSLPLGAPLEKLPAGGRFGARRVFNGEPRSPHGGADFAATPGTVVLAPADGRVVLAEPQFFAGNALFLDHGDGLISMAFHLSRLRVKAGDEVARGQPIGEVGATGRVTGPHLHFAVRWRGARVDPALLLGPPAAIPDLAGD
ncbi:MAG: M23 family metallopeptidase [Holophagales bacterium]|nr:MAG: M23 family metallopeptidase [Holophagales bacterium]